MIEVEGHEYLSSAKVQAVRDTILGIELELYLHKPITIPSGHAMVNYYMLRVPFDTPVRVSHLPSMLDRDRTRGHEGGHIEGRDTKSA
jgi:hypothetical protein